MSTVIRVVMLWSFLLSFPTCLLLAAPQGGSGPPRGSHYERPSAGPARFKERVIVFVHGLFGDVDTSWSSDNGVYWPKLLLEDRVFKDSEVYMAKYDSQAGGNTLPVTEVVGQQNNGLTADGVLEKHHEVVFVCHSLGGIIVQQLLLTFREHAKQVPFVYFFAVPEEGAQIAKFGSLFDSDPMLQALFYGDENEYLLRLENDWRAAHFTIKRYCAYEKKAVKGAILIVDRLSGTRNCDAPPIPINEDHMGIVKPSGTKHDSDIALRNATRANPISHKPPIGPPRKITDVSPAPELPAQPFVTMQISPSSFPVFAPSHSTISILPLHPYRILTDSADYLTTFATDSGEEHYCPTKKEIDSKPAGDYETVFKVEIANHSQETLASCKTTFRLRYNAGLPGGGCMPPKDNSKDQEDVVLIPPLNPGKSFQFFAVNQSNLCVWLIPPAFAKMKMAVDAAERHASLTFDNNPLYLPA